MDGRSQERAAVSACARSSIISRPDSISAAAVSPSRMAESAEHHVEVIRAILDGDIEAAEAESGRLMMLLRAHAETAALT